MVLRGLPDSMDHVPSGREALIDVWEMKLDVKILRSIYSAA